MKTKLYAVRDLTASAYMSIFIMHTDGMAIRAFQTTVNDENSNINKHPDDYNLYSVGEWDDNTGVILPLESPRLIARASELIESESITLNRKDYENLISVIEDVRSGLKTITDIKNASLIDSLEPAYLATN